MIAIQRGGTPEEKAALIDTLKLRKQYGNKPEAVPFNPFGDPQTTGSQQEVVNLGTIE
jgi:hypothetical protein